MKNIFEIFGFEEKYNIDKNLLLYRYLELQKLYHPDVTNNDVLALDINSAYRILNNDIYRLEYLLSEIYHIDLDIAEVDIKVMNEIFEVDSIITSLDINNLETLKIKHQLNLNNTLIKSSAAIDANDITLAVKLFNNIKCYQRLLDKINNVLIKS